MTKSFAESSLKAIDIFKHLVKVPLQNLLGGEVFSVEAEAQAGSPVAKVLDQSASSDVVVRYQTRGAVFSAASRIFYAEHQQCKKFVLSLTLRNSIKQNDSPPGKYRHCTHWGEHHRQPAVGCPKRQPAPPRWRRFWRAGIEAPGVLVMNLAYELLNASREELIAYLRSWDAAYDDLEPDIVLRLMAQRNFQAEGPGAGPMLASGGSNPGCHEE